MELTKSVLNYGHMNPDEFMCPFCRQHGFDLIGLKHHYEMGYCDKYNNTLNIEEERQLLKLKKKSHAEHKESILDED